MTKFPACALVLLAFTASAIAGGFKAYPGAKVDQKASEAAAAMLMAFGDNAERLKATTYTTADSYDKVVAFYKADGKELVIPSNPKRDQAMTLPSGEKIRESVIIFDGAADVVSSRNWVKIQRPFVAAYGFANGKQIAEDVRNVTAITAVTPK